jgi:hypothetical protein
MLYKVESLCSEKDVCSLVFVFLALQPIVGVYHSHVAGFRLLIFEVS